MRASALGTAIMGLVGADDVVLVGAALGQRTAGRWDWRWEFPSGLVSVG